MNEVVIGRDYKIGENIPTDVEELGNSILKIVDEYETHGGRKIESIVVRTPKTIEL